MQDNPIKIAIALGANLGNAAETFQEAVARLEAAGVRHCRLSALIRTAPVDCAPGTPDFFNAALTGEWTGSPEELLHLCQELEIAAGRPRKHGINQSRSLDLDIILFGDTVLQTPALTIPHPRARRRRFVLDPLAEIAADWAFPEDGMTVKAALDGLKG